MDDARIQNPTFALQVKEYCYLSANTRLVALDKAVALSSESLAQKYRDAVMNTMRQRHGDEVTLQIQSCTRDRMSFDDALVLARIEQNMFAPNKRPIMRNETVELSAKEKELLDLFRRCDERGRELILISARVAATSSDEQASRPKCEVIKIF